MTTPESGQRTGNHETIGKNNKDIQHEIDLFKITDPKILEGRIRDLPGYTKKERETLETAIEETQRHYGDRTRKFSDTPAILHAYRLALPAPSEGVVPVAVTIGRLLHDKIEESIGINPQNFQHYGDDVVTFLAAMTRGHEESYQEYLTRIADVDQQRPDLLLVPTKARDIMGNCLDPFALPPEIERKQKTHEGMKKLFAEKYGKYYMYLFPHRHREWRKKVVYTMREGIKANTKSSLALAS
jgi:hypothetical protein